MKTYSRRGDLAGPVLLIGFGALLLLINLGRIPVSLWSALSRLWPLALIVLGLDLLIPRRSVLASILVAGLLMAVLFVGAGLALPTLSSSPAAIEGEAVSVPSSGDPHVNVSLVAGAGRMRVDDHVSGNALVSGEISVPGGQVEQLVEDLGTTTTVLLKTTGVVIVPISFGQGEVWNIAVSTAPLVNLSAELGAGEIRIDASEMNLESVKASTGAGDVEVIVPAGGSTVTLSAAVGQLAVRVPASTPVRLEASSLAGNVQVPPGYRKVGAAYVSPGFMAGDHVEISASLVFGSIVVLEQ
jgi:hypothetical protein